MSINWQQSRVHPLNNSHSKHTFAFDKSPRFRATSKPLCESFYNISRNISSSKGTSMGRGTKTTFGDKNGYPSPLHYDIKTEFDSRNRSHRGIKLSLGRENLKYGGIFQKSETPDPGHYNPKDPRMGTPKSGYSIRPKLKQLQLSFAKNPGPGQYKNYSTISATGIYTLSNISNCICPKIKPTKVYDPQANEKRPGPGHYELKKENLNQKGHYFISKYQDSRCRSFSKSSQRENHKKSLANLPGPGAYNYYSQFGKGSKIL